MRAAGLADVGRRVWPAWGPGNGAGRGSSGEQPAQHVREDAPVAEVLSLARGVDAYARVELDRLPALGLRVHAQLARQLAAV